MDVPICQQKVETYGDQAILPKVDEEKYGCIMIYERNQWEKIPK